MGEEATLREIQKFRLRVKDFFREEKDFVKSLSIYLDKTEELSRKIHSTDTSSVWRKEVLRLRMEAYEALNNALNRQSQVEHGRSHLPESLGSLLLNIEKGFQKYFKETS